MTLAHLGLRWIMRSCYVKRNCYRTVSGCLIIMVTEASLVLPFPGRVVGYLAMSHNLDFCYVDGVPAPTPNCLTDTARFNKLTPWVLERT